jgi:hypothetical protein
MTNERAAWIPKVGDVVRVKRVPSSTWASGHFSAGLIFTVGRMAEGESTGERGWLAYDSSRTDCYMRVEDLEQLGTVSRGTDAGEPRRCSRCTADDCPQAPVHADGLCGHCACDIRNEQRAGLTRAQMVKAGQMPDP